MIVRVYLKYQLSSVLGGSSREIGSTCNPAARRKCRSNAFKVFIMGVISLANITKSPSSSGAISSSSLLITFSKSFMAAFDTLPSDKDARLVPDFIS